MKAEKEKIEKLIEKNKMEKQHKQMWHFDFQGQQWGTFDKDIVANKMELAKQEMELKKQTTMLLQMQQNLLMEKRITEEERSWIYKCWWWYQLDPGCCQTPAGWGFQVQINNP